MDTASTMYTHPQRRSDKLTHKLRVEAGQWLRELREKRGLSQRELAQKVGAEYYTFISQLENGRGRIPPDRYLDWASALGVDKREFVRGLMYYYDPVTYRIIFGPQIPFTKAPPRPDSRLSTDARPKETDRPDPPVGTSPGDPPAGKHAASRKYHNPV
jgi:transcriptional regulator with XRE-family HTH domain